MNGSVSRVWHDRALSPLAQLWAHLPNWHARTTLVQRARAAAVAGLRRNLVNASVASSPAVSPIAASPPAPLPAIRSMYAFYEATSSFSVTIGRPRWSAGAVAGAGLRLQNAAEVALSSFATLGEIVATQRAYTDPALESRPLTGFNTTLRNCVIATNWARVRWNSATFLRTHSERFLSLVAQLSRNRVGRRTVPFSG